MTDLRVVTTEGSDKILEELTVQNLADILRGRLVRPSDFYQRWIVPRLIDAAMRNHSLDAYRR